jgi:hypothetical protein
VEADGDISGVAWEYMENLPNNIKNTIINWRALANFIVSTMIPAIADQSRKEFKWKQESENFFVPTGHTPPRNQRQHDNDRHRRNDDSNNDADER